MSITVKEYNQKYIPKIETAKVFLHALPHAMQKSGAYEEAMHQLRCIGWSDELIKTFKDALYCYQDSLLNKLYASKNNNQNENNNGDAKSRYQNVIGYFNQKLKEEYGDNIYVSIESRIADDGNAYYYFVTKNCGNSDLMLTIMRAYESAREYLSSGCK